MPQQEASAAFQQYGEIVDVRTREIIYADFEYVKNKMWRNDFEFGKIGYERDILYLKLEDSRRQLRWIT
jgi:hypothetical protein